MTRLLAATGTYAGAILLANVLTSRYGDVGVGFGLTATAGTFAAGFALLARDYVHRYGGTRFVLAAIVVGAAASFVLASPALAFASSLAFLAAEVVDLAVFRPLRARRGFVPAAAVSNVVSAPVDTIAFLVLAGFPVTFPIVAGQLVAKLVWSTLVPLALVILARRDEAVAA